MNRLRIVSRSMVLGVLMIAGLAAPPVRAENLVGMTPAYVRDNNLYVFNTTTATLIGGVAVRLPGSVVVGCNGLAVHPGTGELWAILNTRGSGSRPLVKINPATGVASLVGNTNGGNRSFAGITFNADGSNLYGVTGDGSTNDPESLFTLNQTDGTATLLCALGNGSDGEIIAFNPNDGKLYHGSGNSTQVFETIDNTGTCSTTNIPLSNGVNEFLGLAFSASEGQFYVTGFDELFTLSTTGTVNSIAEFVPDIDIKGLTFINNAPLPLPCPPLSPLYVSTTYGNSDQSALWAVDPDSGGGRFVGNIGFERVGALAFGPDNKLYGVGERTGTNTGVLLTIDPCTGVGTEIGPTGVSRQMTDMSFRNSDHVLFAYSNNWNLFTIDTTTGVATLIGVVAGQSGGGNGLAFSSSDVLFHSDNVALDTIDAAAAVATTVSNMVFPPGPANPFIRATCMKFRPGTNNLYAVINEYDNAAGQNDQWYLGVINTTTAVVTKIDQTVGHADGMAFAPPGPDGDFVPTEVDNCPNAFNPVQEDSDGDGVGDACDGCPNDAAKTDLGVCGCGVADSDANGNGTPDCQEQPPSPQPTPPSHVVDRNALLTFLSILFGVPLCAPGTLMVLPLTIVGLTGMKVWRRRRR